MPPPARPALEGLFRAQLAGAGIRGEGSSDLAGAIAETCAQALTIFTMQAMILPGIAASAPPPAGAGATTGPGRLSPPPAGAPDAAALDPIARAQLLSTGLRGENAGALASVVAGTIAAGLRLFTAQVNVAPGIAIAGLVTAAPGVLIGATPTAAALEVEAASLCRSRRLLGDNAPDLACALARALADALGLLRAGVVVVPGIPCSPAATVAPGRLV